MAQWIVAVFFFVAIASAVIGFYRAKNMTPTFKGRLLAVSPSLGAGLVCLVLLQIDIAARSQSAAITAGPTLLMNAAVLLAAVSGGWMLGMIIRSIASPVNGKGG